MHPLSVFPQLLTYQLMAPMLLRVVAGLFILYIGWERYKKSYRYASIVYALCGIILIIGIYTQVSAIVGILVVKLDFLLDRKSSQLTKEKIIAYTIIGITLISLLFTGPGFLAFDLPL